VTVRPWRALPRVPGARLSAGEVPVGSDLRRPELADGDDPANRADGCHEEDGGTAAIRAVEVGDRLVEHDRGEDADDGEDRPLLAGRAVDHRALHPVQTEAPILTWLWRMPQVNSMSCSLSLGARLSAGRALPLASSCVWRAMRRKESMHVS